MRTKSLYSVPLILVLVFLNSFAEETPFLPNSDLDVHISRISTPLRIDGVLDDAVWQQAVKIDHFSETEPGDNILPSVETEVMIAYDEQMLYVAFHCYDDPATIRATMSDRDQFHNDDIIFIILDTFRDFQTAYQLGVNPFGLQVDIYRNLNSQDATFDIVWHSAGQIVEDGWVAEMAIPFKSLRFPDQAEQEWGFHCIRLRPRDSYEEISWAPLDRDNPCFLCQAGTLHGISGVSAGRNLEILPYLISYQTGGLDDPDDPESSFHNEDVDGDIGLNIKYGLTSNLTLDAAVNPDFSQVESDAGQINVNTPFALFYPEKRPFFLEGSDIFRSQIHAVYTRTINDPIVAAKMTGRLKRTSIGYIVARDDHTPFIVPLQERSAFFISDLKSVTNILRIKQDLWEDSFVGFTATSRDVDAGYNRIAGIDANVRFLKDYRFSCQALSGATKEPSDSSVYTDEDGLTFDGNRHTATFDGERFEGMGLSASLSRSARHFNFNLNYRDYSPGFRADNGFIDRNDFRTLGAWTGLLFWPDSRLFDRISPNVRMNWRYEHDGTFKEKWMVPELEMVFKTQTRVNIGGLVINDEHYMGVWHKGVLRGHLRVNTDFSEVVSGGFRYVIGEFIYRGDSTAVGSGHELEIEATVKFSNRFVLESSWNWNKLTGYFDGSIVRNRATYQFTRRLFLRLIAQYDSFNDRLDLDPLLSYKINPFTVLYAGSTHDAVDFEEPYGWKWTDRQFFVKFQYLWRL